MYIVYTLIRENGLWGYDVNIYDWTEIEFTEINNTGRIKYRYKLKIKWNKHNNNCEMHVFIIEINCVMIKYY